VTLSSERVTTGPAAPAIAHVHPAAEAISSSFEASFTEGTLPARSEDQAALRDCENWLVRCGIYVG